MEEMLKKGVHFGYSSTTLNPKMKPFIFACRNNTEIFDLGKTLNQLSLAKEFLRTLGKEKKPILFVGTKKETKENTESFARELNMPYVAERWLGGTLTNFETMLLNIKKFHQYEDKLKEKDKLIKKEYHRIEKEKER